MPPILHPRRSQDYNHPRGCRFALEDKSMIQCGSVAFTNPDDYQAAMGIGGASFSLVLTDSAAFKARLTCLKLRHLHLLSGRESVPRIACVSLPSARAFVSFPASVNAPLIWGGVELRSGDIVFHSRGEHTHQWTKGPSNWGLISAAAPSARRLRQGADGTGPRCSANRSNHAAAVKCGTTPTRPAFERYFGSLRGSPKSLRTKKPHDGRSRASAAERTQGSLARDERAREANDDTALVMRAGAHLSLRTAPSLFSFARISDWLRLMESLKPAPEVLRVTALGRSGRRTSASSGARA